MDFDFFFVQIFWIFWMFFKFFLGCTKTFLSGQPLGRLLRFLYNETNKMLTYLIINVHAMRTGFALITDLLKYPTSKTN